MKTVTVEYNVYKYNELNDKAKEKVREWYFDGQEPFIFEEDCKEDLRSLFGKNALEVQFSLASCQGDGFNIYGNIDAHQIFHCLEMHNGGRQLAKYEGVMTEEEKNIILAYAEECGAIVLPMNHHY